MEHGGHHVGRLVAQVEDDVVDPQRPQHLEPAGVRRLGREERLPQVVSLALVEPRQRARARLGQRRRPHPGQPEQLERAIGRGEDDRRRAVEVAEVRDRPGRRLDRLKRRRAAVRPGPRLAPHRRRPVRDERREHARDEHDGRGGPAPGQPVAQREPQPDDRGDERQDDDDADRPVPEPVEAANLVKAQGEHDRRSPRPPPQRDARRARRRAPSPATGAAARSGGTGPSRRRR